MNKLYRCRDDRKILGICSGVAKFFGLDPTIIRVAWAVMIVFGGTGVLLYILMAFIIPEEPYDSDFIDHDKY